MDSIALDTTNFIPTYGPRQRQREDVPRPADLGVGRRSAVQRQVQEATTVTMRARKARDESENENYHGRARPRTVTSHDVALAQPTDFLRSWRKEKLNKKSFDL